MKFRAVYKLLRRPFTLRLLILIYLHECVSVLQYITKKTGYTLSRLLKLRLERVLIHIKAKSTWQPVHGCNIS